MKKIVNIILVGILAISVHMVSYADASASKRKRCIFGTKYKAKAKVNGPSCSKNKSVERSCNSAFAEVYIYKLPWYCACYKEINHPEKQKAAHAKASSNAGGTSIYTNRNIYVL